MAYKIVVLGTDIIVSTKGMGSVSQKVPLSSTNEGTYALGIGYSLLYQGGLSQANGGCTLTLRDKDNSLVKKMVRAGQVGGFQDNNTDLSVGANLVAQGTDALINEQDLDSVFGFNYGVSPTLFSTGSLDVTFSGGLPDAMNMNFIAVLYGSIPVPLATIHAVGKNSGNIGIKINFSVVTI